MSISEAYHNSLDIRWFMEGITKTFPNVRCFCDLSKYPTSSGYVDLHFTGIGEEELRSHVNKTRYYYRKGSSKEDPLTCIVGGITSEMSDVTDIVTMYPPYHSLEYYTEDINVRNFVRAFITRFPDRHCLAELDKSMVGDYQRVVTCTNSTQSDAYEVMKIAFPDYNIYNREESPLDFVALLCDYSSDTAVDISYIAERGLGLKKRIEYIDFTTDEAMYLFSAYEAGMRYNAMIAQAQRICEGYLKQIITRSLMNATDAMMSHNLRELYDYVISLGIDISAVRTDVMSLNNYYTHTRYPGRDAFIAQKVDIENAVECVRRVAQYMAPIC